MPAFRYPPTAASSFEVLVNKNYSPKYLGNSKMNVFGCGYVWSVVINPLVTTDLSDLYNWISWMRTSSVTLAGGKSFWLDILSARGINKVGELTISQLESASDETFQAQMDSEKYSVVIKDAKGHYVLNFFTESIKENAPRFINSVELESQGGKFNLDTAKDILQDIYTLIVISDAGNPNQELLANAAANWNGFRNKIIEIAKTNSDSSSSAKTKGTKSFDKQKEIIRNKTSAAASATPGNNADVFLDFDETSINLVNDPSTQTNTFTSTQFNEIASLLDIIRQETIQITKVGDDDVVTIKGPEQTLDSNGLALDDSSNIQPCSAKSLEVLMESLSPAERNSLKLALDYQLKLEQFKLDSITLQLNKLMSWPEFDLAAFGAGIQSAYTTGLEKGKEELDALLKGFQTSKKSFGNIYSTGLDKLKSIEFKAPKFGFSIPPVKFKIDSKLLINLIKKKYGQKVADAVQCNLNELTGANNKSNTPETVAQVQSQSVETARKAEKLNTKKEDAQKKVEDKIKQKEAVVQAEMNANAKIPKKVDASQIYLSENFTLEELTRTDQAGLQEGNLTSALASPQIMSNLTALAALLEQVRSLFGKPITINSGYRDEAVNAAVGGTPTSQHLTGSAADFLVSGFADWEGKLFVVRAIRDSSIQFGQLLLESGAIHISLGSKREVAQYIDGVKTALVNSTSAPA